MWSYQPMFLLVLLSLTSLPPPTLVPKESSSPTSPSSPLSNHTGLLSAVRLSRTIPMPCFPSFCPMACLHTLPQASQSSDRAGTGSSSPKKLPELSGGSVPTLNPTLLYISTERISCRTVSFVYGWPSLSSWVTSMKAKAT